MVVSSPQCLITVAICTRNRAALLEKAIRSVLEQISPRAEILIVDNGSSDHTEPLVAGFAAADPRVKFFHERQTGLSFARNSALRQATGQWVIFLDDDAQAEPGWLAAYEKFFARLPDEKIVCAGGPVTPFYASPPPRWLHPAANHLAGPATAGPVQVTRALWGCNYAVRREAALGIGGFNVKLGHNDRSLGANEETELADRLRQAGGEIWWLPEARIKHFVMAEKTKLTWRIRNAFGQGRSRVINRLSRNPTRLQRGVFMATRVLVAPFHCGLNLLVALVSFPFQNGQAAARALVNAASTAGLAFEAWRQFFQGDHAPDRRKAGNPA
jgi:glycosyltransferase involved in cell wall biosynthesis